MPVLLVYTFATATIRAAANAAGWPSPARVTQRLRLWFRTPRVSERITHRGVLPEPPTDPDPDADRRCQRLRRAAILTLAALAVVLAIGVPLALGLARLAPRWWRTIDPKSPATIQVANYIEGTVTELMSQVRPAAADVPGGSTEWRSEPWAFTIRAADANAWINARLPKWVANQNTGKPTDIEWPAQIDQVQVEFTHGKIHVGARVFDDDPPNTTASPRSAGAHPRRAQIFTATLVPVIAPDGSLWLRAEALTLGSLPLPASLLLGGAATGPGSRALPEKIRSLPQTQTLLRAFNNETPIAKAPIVRGFDDVRAVRILRIDPGDSTITITCRTERR